MSHDSPDGTYARRVQNGDRDAYEVLVERYEGMVFDLTHQYAGRPEEAEDLAQDIFLQAYRQIEDLSAPNQFASWLYSIALNRCRDYAKNVRRETYPFSHTGREDGSVVDHSSERQDDRLASSGQTERLWNALKELSPTYATPFLLKYRDGLTYKAMSKRLDVSVSALKVRVHRARKKLRTLMEPDHEQF